MPERVRAVKRRAEDAMREQCTAAMVRLCSSTRPSRMWLIGPSQDHIDGSMLAIGVVSQDIKGSLALEDVAVLIPFFTGEVVSQSPGKGQHSFGDAEMRLNYAIATLCSVSKYFHGDVIFGVRIFEIRPTSACRR